MSHTFTITISDEEYSAVGKIILDPDDWVDKVISNKAIKCILDVVEATLKDVSQLLNPTDKATLVTYIIDNDLVMVPWRQWPQGVLRQIAQASLLQPPT